MHMLELPGILQQLKRNPGGKNYIFLLACPVRQGKLSSPNAIMQKGIHLETGMLRSIHHDGCLSVCLLVAPTIAIPGSFTYKEEINKKPKYPNTQTLKQSYLQCFLSLPSSQTFLSFPFCFLDPPDKMPLLSDPQRKKFLTERRKPYFAISQELKTIPHFKSTSEKMQLSRV